MGTFQGHLLPGGLFTLFGIWWTSQIVRRQIMCNMQGRRFYASVTYPCPMHGRCVSFPLESVVKMIVTAIGMCAELLAATNFGQGGGFVFMGDLQHVTMYAFFFLSGAIDILSSYNKVPVGLDYLACSLAFLAEGILFMGHLHGLTPLVIYVHKLLVFAILACVGATMVEFRWQDSLLAGLGRAYFTLLQGTWFIQIGFILHNPVPGANPWDQNSHDSLMVTTLAFTWHFFGVFLGMLLIAWLTRFLVCRVCRVTTEDIAYELIPVEAEPLMNEHTLYNMDEPYSEGEDPYSGIQTDKFNDYTDQYSMIATNAQVQS